jgi:hypothetical protein
LQHEKPGSIPGISVLAKSLQLPWRRDPEKLVLPTETTQEAITFSELFIWQWLS